MKTKASKTNNFVWTDIQVVFNREERKFYIVQLDGVCPVYLDNLSGELRDNFENDLVKGPDTFLVNIWEVGEDYYNFDIIMKTDVPEEIVEYFPMLAEFVIKLRIEEPLSMTLRLD